ncbi:hypothetical protein AWJ20_3680 [Sugiyamaella lignohabitans]|uniref:Uncharacterized protein n=1 Tax=Sugiyamaella lignohabitans TaxID=796027 RepID=A0A170R008_9ASCO|nr:uncharacterized protein AWJ20_3680 [Sugiyamaella lignohabitans]ANB16029.1 hypothetical protein AWJ20_3680 [Sugiyamaella lignohabitans]
MQFSVFEPQYYRRPQYSYEDIVSYLAQQEYENQLAEEYRRRQIIAAQEEAKRQRYLEYLRAQEERRIAEEQRRRALVEAQYQHELALRKKRLQQEKARQQALRQYYEEQQRERERKAAQLYYQQQPAFSFVTPFWNHPQYQEESTDEDVEDPDVSVPSDDYEDLYSRAAKCSTSCVPSPANDLPNAKPTENVKKPVSSDSMDIDDFVSNIFTHFLGRGEPANAAENTTEFESKESLQNQEQASEKQQGEQSNKADSDESEPVLEVSEEERASTIKAKLNEISSKLSTAVETYERLFNSETSDNEPDHPDNAKAYLSRIKILQKTQMQLEKLYTELDGIRQVPKDLKKLKHDLTSKSVTVADKVDDLIRVLEEHRTELLEKELRESEEGSSGSDTESASDISDTDHEEQLSDSSETSQPKREQEERQPKAKKIRRVVIETVPDDDSF